nr:immunoglobulin heavy chain junction region [Mus musculus]
CARGGTAQATGAMDYW